MQVLQDKASMILNFHPDEQHKRFRGFRFIGYWHSVTIDSKTLEVKELTGLGSYETGLLPLPSDYIDSSWDPKVRDQITQHLNKGREFNAWRGDSSCRFGCGSTKLGYRDFTDGLYVWPEGFSHYLEHHGVKPPEEFIRHVLNTTTQVPC